MFVGASAEITGTSHEAEGLPCQDRAASWMSENGTVGIIVLCDGAGSCSSSEIGAELLCTWFPKWVDSRKDWWALKPDEITGVVVPAIRERLEAEAASEGVTFKSLSSTFLAVTTRRFGGELAYRILHLGDGVAACISRDGKIVVSEPDNGEFANETVFTTSKLAQSSLRVMDGTVPIGSGFVLMSDGGATSLFLKSKRALAPAVAEMIAWLNDHDSATVSQALEANGKELLTKNTGDDCSIALLLDRDPNSRFDVTLEHPQPEKFIMSDFPIKFPRKLIEVALPLDAINAACAREKSIRHGHPSTLHLWWAEYPTDWDPRTPVWETLHLLIRALKQGGESASDALLAALGGKAEAVRQLAYRLYTLCERLGQAEDAHAYNELITSWTGIETASTSAPKPAQGDLFV